MSSSSRRLRNFDTIAVQFFSVVLLTRIIVEGKLAIPQSVIVSCDLGGIYNSECSRPCRSFFWLLCGWDGEGPPPSVSVAVVGFPIVHLRFVVVRLLELESIASYSAEI